MNVHEELIQRCAARRRKALGDLSDQGFAELLLAVRENPSAFVDSPAEAVSYTHLLAAAGSCGSMVRTKRSARRW